MKVMDVKRWIAFLIMLCLVLLMQASTAEARRRRDRHRYTDNDEGHTPSSNSPGFLHYFVIVVIVLGAILVSICLFLNSLRCILSILNRRSQKQAERQTRPRHAHQRARHQLDVIDQSELLPPPSYTEIVGEVTAPPPAYSTLHVGDAGWASPPSYDEAGQRTEEHTI